MSEEDLRGNRRTTRLTIAIPVIISGHDSQGNTFSESVHTLIVNKHGAKIATARRFTLGTEVVIENPHLGVVAKATVVWFGEKQPPRDLNQVGVQLLEEKDIWGIAFPPNDWGLEPEDLTPAQAVDRPDAGRVTSAEAGTHAPSLAAEEISIRYLQELQESANAHAREFQDRLTQLTQQLGRSFESDLRERAAGAKAREAGALQDALKVLRDNLSAAKEEIRTLEAKIQELKSALQATAENLPPTPIKEARRQLVALTNSVVESMNRAADAGLREYRSLLQKENHESAARQHPPAAENPSPPQAPLPDS